MAEKSLDKMLLGELIAELNKTRDQIKSADITDPDPNVVITKIQYRENLQKYESQVYDALNKKEEVFTSHHSTPVYND